ncbi:hypothetical protein SCUCBS95973_006300 [Sporothrix curviconia]|uniref:Importin N-terminal domain-containing protein n=1 Tax=Sporothrix curviconia TaxID=1260050 RepID=A0ABP0C522_9PEZI
MSFAIEVPGAAVPLNLPDLCKALQAGNSSDHSQRQAASQQLDEWQTHQTFFSSLQSIFLDRTLPYEVRFLAIILLKNGIDKYWRSAARLKGGLHPDEKALIRSRLFQGTVGEPNPVLALHNALATAKIVRVDYPQDWATALPDLVVLLRSLKDMDPAGLHGALLLLLRVIKELSTARLRRSQTALQHIAEELFFLLDEIYQTNTAVWIAYLNEHSNGGGQSMDQNTYQRMVISFAALKVLRHLTISGFEFPHRSEIVTKFWSVTQMQFMQLIGFFKTSGGNSNSNSSISEANSGNDSMDLVAKHLLKFAKLHLDMSEAHPASFAALPASVDMVGVYWNLVDDFAVEYIRSGGLRQTSSGGAGSGGSGGESKSAKFEGPLLERLALRGLLLLKSCIQIITQPLQTFKYRSAEAQKDQSEGVQRIKTQLFTDDFILKMVNTIITKLFHFRQSDLEAWEEDPEVWETQESELGAAWEWQVRPCAEKVFLSLLIHNKQLLVPPLLSYFQQAMSTDADLLTKEAVYTAMCNASVAMGASFDFNAFVHSTLVNDVQVQGPLAKILRRRVAILLGSWAFYELPEESLKLVYSMYAHLLNKADPANDEVVRLTAARQLKATVDDFQFRAVAFEPHATSVFSAMIELLQEVESDETKLAVLATMRTFIERMETIAGQFSDGVVNALPAIWESAPADTFMIKQAVLTILSTLIMALGAASQKYHGLILPLIADAMNPASPVHQFLFEEAIELWHSIMNQSSPPLAPELVALLPLALQVLDYDSQLVQASLEIVNAYIILAPESVLADTYRRPTLQALAGAMEARKWELVKAATTSVQNLVRQAHLLGSTEGLAVVVRDLLEIGLLPRMLERLHGQWEARQSTGPKAKPSPIKPTTLVEYVLILSRIALADPHTFVDVLSTVSSNSNVGAMWPWLASEWFGSFDAMGNPEYQKVASMALTRLAEVQTVRGSNLSFQELVLGRLQEYFSMWTSTVMEAQGAASLPDCFVWPDGAPAATEWDTPLSTAESAFAAKDPLHTETLYAFIVLRLQDLMARAGGEQAFEANWMVNVDRDVLAGFRRLTEPPSEVPDQQRVDW